MDKPQKRGFWERINAAFGAPEETYAEVITTEGTTPLTGVTPPPRPTGPILDPRTALGINAVYRAVEIIKGAVSQLPLAVQRGGADIDTPSLIAKPDVRSTQTVFLSLTVHSLATHGNAYWRLHRAVEGPFEPVASIEVLNPELVYVDYDKGRKVYRYGSTVFADWQVQHLMIFPTFEPGTNLIKGLGPIQANRTELQAILELNAFAQGFYRNGGIPTGVLTTDSQYITTEDSDAIRSRWNEVAALNGVQVLANGFKFQPVSLDPEKAQFHASAQKAVVDVARMFGIPANYLLAAIDGTAMTYSNMQDVDRTLIRYTLMTYLTAIEDAFSELLPRGQRAKFNIDAFLRGTTKERYEAQAVAITAGIMTVDEARALNDLPPLSKGDAPTN